MMVACELAVAAEKEHKGVEMIEVHADAMELRHHWYFPTSRVPPTLLGRVQRDAEALRKAAAAAESVDSAKTASA